MRLFWAAVFALACNASSIEDQQFNGRWDITVKGDNSHAWWLEVSGAGTDSIKGKFIGAPGGQLDEIPKVTVYEGELRFSFDRHYRRETPAPRNAKPALQKGLYYARLENGKLKGTFEIEGDPTTFLEWTGVRAPAINDKDDGTWKKGEPVNLFDARDLNGWLPTPGHAPWVVKQGILSNAPASTDLVTEKKFWNFSLHIEYRIGAGSNSGIGLRGRYEIQISDDGGKPATVHSNGAVYGRIAPSMNASKDPGEWQTLDIRLIGRQVTVFLNALRIIEKQTIDGLTAIAIDANEADPGPIVLQGDHGAVEFRKITLYPLVHP